jgi:hypothetical protein
MSSSPDEIAIFQDNDVRRFITEHEKSDIRALALKKPPHPDWPYALILDQIKARQKATTKIPAWHAHPDVIFPSSDTVEQASSAATALYKASLVHTEQFVDLTAGAGVDSWAFMQNVQSGTCIEKSQSAAALLKHNLTLLCTAPLDIINTSAETYIETMPQMGLAYVDPQRREGGKRGLFRLQDGQPNVSALLDTLKTKAKKIMVKTAPMLDIHQAIEDLQHVCTVHIVQWQGECKEVLYILDPAQTIPAEEIPVHAVILDDNGHPTHKMTFTRAEEQSAEAPLSAPEAFLYEPGPAIQKSGGFNSVAQIYGLNKLHKHTHLYTAAHKLDDFPGRVFEICDTYAANAKALPFAQANLSIRNFPADVATLKKKLKLKDGGDEYLFACTLHDERKVLIHTRKPKI